MNINPDAKDSLSLNFNVGGNSPPANPNGYNGRGIAAFQMENGEWGGIGVGASRRDNLVLLTNNPHRLALFKE